MSRGPAAPSSAYRENGRPHAVHAYGLVLFLTPQEYAFLRSSADGDRYPDATEDQIRAHDQWFAHEKAESEREWQEFRRLFEGR